MVHLMNFILLSLPIEEDSESELFKFALEVKQFLPDSEELIGRYPLKFLDTMSELAVFGCLEASLSEPVPA